MKMITAWIIEYTGMILFAIGLYLLLGYFWDTFQIRALITSVVVCIVMYTLIKIKYYHDLKENG